MRVPLRRRATLLVLLSVGPLAACGSDLALPPDGALPSELVLTAADGDQQQGTVASALPRPVVVELADTAGQPAAGVAVAFVPADSAAGEAVPDTAVTDASGHASTRWVLGTATGQQQLDARVGPAGGRQTVRFVAQAEPGLPDSVAAVAGDGQQGPRDQPLPDSLVVQVTDRYGNPVAGVSVTWRVEAGGGKISARAVTTGADGLAAVEWRLGSSIFPQRVSASVSGLAGSPVLFTAFRSG